MSSTQIDKKTTGVVLPGWLVAILRVILIAGLPLALTLVTARALMTPLYMQWEYNRPDFPADPFGFTTQDRLLYGPLAQEYLFNDMDTEFLSEQNLSDGTPLYNERELSHMNDVKEVVQKLTRFGLGLVAVVAISIVLLAISERTRPDLYASLRAGSILTVMLIVAGLIAATTAFDWLFTQFHGLFFEGTSWLFPTSDTLIRLFPEQFWIDAFVLVFGSVLVEALIIGGAAWWMGKARRSEPIG
jgi:integral membrane protein (TIGR01906 family)